MAYSVNSISTKADCDLLINIATKDKGDLEFRKVSLQRQQTNYSENSVEIAAELTAVNAELSALTTIINSLPDGETKDAQITRKKKAELKQFLLTERKDNYGSVALLSKELDLERVQKEIAEINAFVVAIEARKSAIA